MRGKKAKLLRKIARQITDNPVTEYDDKPVKSTKYSGFITKIARLKPGCDRCTYQDLKKLAKLAARRQGYAASRLGYKESWDDLYRSASERAHNRDSRRTPPAL